MVEISSKSSEKDMLYTIFTSFQADFNHVIIEMIERPKSEGSQSLGTIGQALLPLLAVTAEDSNPSFAEIGKKPGPWLGRPAW